MWPLRPGSLPPRAHQTILYDALVTRVGHWAKGRKWLRGFLSCVGLSVRVNVSFSSVHLGCDRVSERWLKKHCSMCACVVGCHALGCSPIVLIHFNGAYNLSLAAIKIIDNVNQVKDIWPYCCAVLIVLCVWVYTVCLIDTPQLKTESLLYRDCL